MVFLVLHSKNIVIKYGSYLVSRATFVVVIFRLFTIIFPLVVAYHTGGFWLKTDSFYEQPKVNLQGHYIFVAETTNQSEPIFCQTYRKYFSQYNFCSALKIREVDENLDGKPDELFAEIAINKENLSLTSLYVMLPIVNEIKEVCPQEILSLILYQHEFKGKISELQLYGHLQIFQSNAMLCGKKFTHEYMEPIFDDDEFPALLPENLIPSYLERDVTTHLTNVYTVTKTDSRKFFKMTLHVKYPQQKIYYSPGFWQIIKRAWIEYLAIYVVLFWFTERMKEYIFDKKLVWFYEKSPFINKN